MGFGKRLLGVRRGETDYRISAIPLGGYVKMSGENPMDERTGDPGEFLSHPRWHRFIIAIAGPAMNILLAIGLLTGIYMVHYEYPVYLDQPAVIGWIEEDSPAAKLGLQPGDQIVRIDGIDNPKWEQVEPKVELSPNQPLEISVQRGNQTFSKTITPEAYGVSQIGFAGWDAKRSLEVTELEPGMPAEKAGVQVGDQIVALDGKPMIALGAMIEELKKTKSKPIELTVSRDGQLKNFTIQPVLADVQGTGQQAYRIGIGSLPLKIGSMPFAAALNRSLDENKKTSLLILELMQKLVQRKMSIRTIEGPIGIGRAAGEAAQAKRLDAAAGADFRHQSEPRNFQPAPNSHPRRRRNSVALRREPDGPRHQPADQRTHLSGGICIPGPVRSHGYLQRPGQDPAWVGGQTAVTPHILSF